MILVTGGAGFIGSNFILDWLQEYDEPIVNLDALTYSGNKQNLVTLEGNSNYIFIRGDICDREIVRELLNKHQPRAILHFAAESHVDRSIHGPEEFVQTNVVGTFRLLDETLTYWKSLTDTKKEVFRFLHVSTDEVYGSLGDSDPLFTESKQYEPNSPYSASKAASDHFVRAYHHTYGLPVITTNCSNNYGKYQFPEKLIPLIISNALQGKALPIYGDGLNIRDWLYVSDHCHAIRVVLGNGRIGETYNIGGVNEIANIEIVKMICSLLDEMAPRNKGKYEELITFVKDRPGHDRRYAIDTGKIQSELNWSPKETFETGIRKTVSWYLDNMTWIDNITSGEYRHWVDKNYTNRNA